MANQELTGLMVRIRADLSDYVLKLAEFERQTGGASNKASVQWNKVATAAATAATAITAAAAVAIKKAVDWGKAVDDLSDKTGMAGEESSKFLVLAQRTNMDLGTAQTMWARFAKNVFEAADAQAKVVGTGRQAEDALSMLGIAAVNTDGTMRSATEIFKDVRDRLNELPDGLQKSALEMKLFGRSGTEMHDILAMTNSEIDETIKKAEALGLILDSKTAASIEMFDRNLNTAKGTLSSIGLTIGVQMIPMLQEMLDDTQGVAKSLAQMDEEQKKNIGSLIEIVAKVGGATAALRALTIVLGLTLNPWVALTVATLAAAKALDDYLDSKKRVDSYSGEPVKKVTVYDNGVPTEAYFKKVEVTDPIAEALRGVNAPRNEYAGYGYRRLSSDEEAAQRRYEADVAYGQETNNPVFNERQTRDRERQRIEQMARDAAAGNNAFLGGGGGGSSSGQSVEDRTKEIASLNAGLRDELKKLTKDELTYKLWAIDEWVKKQTEAGADVELIQAVAAERRKAIDKETSDTLQAAIDSEVKKNKEAADQIIKDVERIAEAEREAAQQVSDSWSYTLADMATGFDNLTDFMKYQWRDFIADVFKQNMSFGGSGNIFTDLIGGVFGIGGGSSGSSPAGGWIPSVTARASGGPVDANKPYVIGEEGIELFVPRTSGVIVPNNKLGGGNVTYVTENHMHNTFSSLDPQSNMEMFEKAWPIYETKFIKAAKTKPAVRNAIRGAM